MEKTIQSFRKRTKVVWADDDDEVRTALRRKGGYRMIVVSHKTEGWPEAANEGRPGLQLCCTPNHLSNGMCKSKPIWRIMSRGSGYNSTGYYCDEHLDAELRPDNTQGELL